MVGGKRLVHPVYMREKPIAYGTINPSTGLTIPYIRKYRGERSLESVAADLERAGLEITHASLGRIERGLQPWNQRLLEALGRLWRVPPTHLVDRDPDVVPEPPGQRGKATRRQVLEATPTVELLAIIQSRTTK